MELTLNKAELAGALPALGKLVSRTSLTKMYQAIQIEGKANALSFCTRNDTEEIEFRLPADLENGFPAALVEFEQFRLAVRNSKKKTLVLEFDKGDVLIEGIKLNPIAGRFPEPDVIPDRDACVTELPADTLSAMSLLAPLADKGGDIRKVLSGINISRDGFTATNGKELSNIPLPLETTGSVTIPFPLTPLATKAFGESGKITTWQKDEDTHFELMLGNWTWRAKAIRGNYPDWKRVVPDRTEATHYVSFQDDRAERLMRYLKSIPDDKEHNNAVKLCRLPEVPDNLHLESSNGMLFSILAEFDENWGDLSITVRKEVLLHLLNAGHRKIELNDAYGPIVGTGGTGQYIAMPIITKTRQAQSEQNAEQTTSEQTDTQPAVQPEQPAPKATEQKIETTTTNTNTTPSTKEKITMIDTNTVTIPHAASANTQTSAPNYEHENEPSMLDDLTASIEELKSKLVLLSDESVTISRKLRKFAIAQRQKDREYRQAKRALNRVHVVSAA